MSVNGCLLKFPAIPIGEGGKPMGFPSKTEIQFLLRGIPVYIRTGLRT